MCLYYPRTLRTGSATKLLVQHAPGHHPPVPYEKLSPYPSSHQPSPSLWVEGCRPCGIDIRDCDAVDHLQEEQGLDVLLEDVQD